MVSGTNFEKDNVGAYDTYGLYPEYVDCDSDLWSGIFGDTYGETYGELFAWACAYGLPYAGTDGYPTFKLRTDTIGEA